MKCKNNKWLSISKLIIFTFALVAHMIMSIDNPSLMLSYYAITQTSNDSGGNSDSVRYLGSSWGSGYSWASQSVLGSITATFSWSAGMSFNSEGVVVANGTTSASNSTTYNLITCCNPSNDHIN